MSHLFFIPIIDGEPSFIVSPTTPSSEDFQNLLKCLLTKSPDKRFKHTNVIQMQIILLSRFDFNPKLSTCSFFVVVLKNKLARVTESRLLDAERQELEKEDDGQEDHRPDFFIYLLACFCFVMTKWYNLHCL